MAGRMAGLHEGHRSVAVLALLAVVGSARELGLVRFPLPSSSWQVPKRWVKKPVETTALLYGFLLGMAVTTRILHATLFVGLAACFIVGDVRFGVGAMMLYGLARAIAVLVVVARNRTPDQAQRFICTSGGLSQVAAIVNGLALAAFAVELCILLAT